jgi:hypothetical protein
MPQMPGSSRPSFTVMTVTMTVAMARYGGALPRFLANVTVTVGVSDQVAP